jgi:hypothetical protein
MRPGSTGGTGGTGCTGPRPGKKSNRALNAERPGLRARGVRHLRLPCLRTQDRVPADYRGSSTAAQAADKHMLMLDEHLPDTQPRPNSIAGSPAAFVLVRGSVDVFVRGSVDHADGTLGDSD